MKQRWLIIIFIVMYLGACTAQKEGNKLNPGNGRSDSEHFTYVLYDDLSEQTITPVSEYLEKHYFRILEVLQVQELPSIAVRIWSNNENYLNEQERSIGARYPGSTGYVTSNELRLLYSGNGTAPTALHEFVHIVSMEVNPSIANNPRWLWETAAIYISAFPPSYSSWFRDMKLADLPTLEELNRDFNYDTDIYSVGYSLGEFITHEWGEDSLHSLILANGDIQSLFQLSEEEFRVNWYRFLEENGCL